MRCHTDNTLPEHTNKTRQCQCELVIKVSETSHHCPRCKAHATFGCHSRHDFPLLKDSSSPLHLSFAGTGTGTLKQTKVHGMWSTDNPSNSASLPEPAGTLSSTSLGYNYAREAVDGELRFSEAADHLTCTTAMTGEAVAKAVTMQVIFLCQPSLCLLVCLAVSQSVACLHAG